MLDDKIGRPIFPSEMSIIKCKYNDVFADTIISIISIIKHMNIRDAFITGFGKIIGLELYELCKDKSTDWLVGHLLASSSIIRESVNNIFMVVTIEDGQLVCSKFSTETGLTTFKKVRFNIATKTEMERVISRTIFEGLLARLKESEPNATLMESLTREACNILYEDSDI